MTTPQSQPYAVAAMLKHFYRPPWERYDGYCDDKGMCWFKLLEFGPGEKSRWVLQKPSECLGHETVSLPHWAISNPFSPHSPSQQP
jgi:hypothetical protein